MRPCAIWSRTAITLADRQQDGVQHLVDALDHVPICALECRGVAALLQLSLPAEFRQFRQFGLELLQHQGDAVDILLHPFVVALVGLGDHFIDLAVGYLVKDAVSLADRQQGCVQQFVDGGKHRLRVAARHADVGAGRQRACRNGLREALDLRQCERGPELSSRPSGYSQKVTCRAYLLRPALSVRPWLRSPQNSGPASFS